jgi:exodeoxyribonuclease-5
VSLVLSPEQERARTTILQWYRSPHKIRPYFFLTGPAGSGKTQLTKSVLSSIRGTVLCAGPTGKSATVLSKRTGLPAQTIHSLIYKPAGTGGNKEAVNRLKKEIESVGSATDKGRVLTKELEKLLSEVKPLFTLNLDSPLKDAQLLIVDECSMVPHSVLEDLISFDIPMLVQGDPFQLQPVGGKSFFKTSECDFALTEVHRQAKDSPIIYLATLAREGKSLPIGQHGESLVTRQVSVEQAMAHDQIIVGKNDTRHATNDKVRSLLGRVSPFPEPGDKLMCLHNNSKSGLMNGAKFVATSYDDISSTKCIIGVKGDDINSRFVAHKEYFLRDKPDPWNMQAADHFGYSFAATCHKMQGDQAESVYVYDQSRFFKGQEKAWSYTAITRASHRVTVRI